MTPPPTKRSGTVLVVDDTPANLQIVSAFLVQAGYQVLVAEDGTRAREVVQQMPPDLILLDVLMPEANGFETCQHFKADAQTRDIPIIFMTALAETTAKLQGFAAGAVDYITKPFQQDEVLARVHTHLALQQLRRQLEAQNAQLEEQNQVLQAEIQAHTQTKQTVHYLQEELESERGGPTIIGHSRALRRVLDEIQQVAQTDCTTLLIGETGTGKEALARAVHAHSQRAEQPLITVNCAAIPTDLVESEFFGHEKGAFTGATSRRLGRFELAHRGTLFLDEVGELPLDIQGKLLRVLQEQEFERVGGETTQRVDVRLIAATNRNLEAEVATNRFREDLFYRLNVFPVHVPPLRHRQEDLPLLIEHFVQKFSRKHGKPLEGVSQASLAELRGYAWPGNIRELANVIERAVIVTKGPLLEMGRWFRKAPEETVSPPSPGPGPAAEASSPFLSLEEMEKAHILRALDVTKWRVGGEKGAAQLLGLNRSTLRARMDKLGITREE